MPERPQGALHVSRWMDLIGGHVQRHPRFWIRLGDWESRMLRAEIDALSIQSPIYVSGIARAGSTILLEWLGRHPDCATHRYKDYPLVHIPYWWNAFLSRTPQRSAGPAERAHADGIMITPESPEAFEEVLWMSFFPESHSPEHSNVIDGRIRHPHFESFYRDHIRKLLLVRGGRRYLSKANYHVTRLEYLQLLFTDARFVIPVREPVWHIASLMKQHRLFCEQEAANVKALAHMQRVGHYEFGLDRRPINPGDDGRTAEIRELWAQGREVEGWARYWAMIYGYLAARLEAGGALAERSLVVRYEDLCQSPEPTLRGIFSHCGLDPPAPLITQATEALHLPDYYRPRFSDAELALIAEITAAAASRFGYTTAKTD